MQGYSEEFKSNEEVIEDIWRFTVLTEWESTCLPPQSEEVCLLSSYFYSRQGLLAIFLN